MNHDARLELRVRAVHHTCLCTLPTYTQPLYIRSQAGFQASPLMLSQVCMSYGESVVLLALWAASLTETLPTLTPPKDQKHSGSNIYHVLRPKTQPF